VLAQSSSFLYTRKQAKIDIARVNKIIKKPILKRESEQIDIILYTWDQHIGDLIYWNFIIRDNDITIKERKVVLEAIGPRHSILTH
jgi:hypothetical protein